MEMIFPYTNWDPQESDEFWIRDERVETVRRPVWEYGIDIVVGPLMSKVLEGASDEFSSFERVRSTFCFEVGQKVGMAVIFTNQSKPTKYAVAGVGEREKEISEDRLAELYGVPGEVNIHTGEILHVGSDHIEYDMHAFTGCSGAIVFLLDQDQPLSVQQCDYGKAIAVHAGGHPFLVARNSGFTLPDLLTAVAAAADQS